MFSPTEFFINDFQIYLSFIGINLLLHMHIEQMSLQTSIFYRQSVVTVLKQLFTSFM